MTQFKLDHITVVARTLEEGRAHVQNELGIDMPAGGAHPLMGTHNGMLSLGNDCFLELIAIDPDVVKPNRPRWFGLDEFDSDPVLATWVLGTDDIAVSLAGAHPQSGKATRITRGDLSWLISIADDGRMPLDGAFPTFIEWPEGPHPAASMVDLGCRLRCLSVEHPHADDINALISEHVDPELISIRHGPNTRLRARLDTPTGVRELS